MAITGIDLDRLIDDRPEEGVFRVRRDVFCDAEIFEAEIKHIFERTWNYVAHESQLPAPNDFLTSVIGRQPVLVMRNRDGALGGFLNSCRHRGTLLCGLKSGNRKFHVCSYHGWSYDSAGRNVGIPMKKEGRYPEAFESQGHDLTALACFANYRGFLFASLSGDVPPIEEYLGDARVFLDMIADQSEEGLEFVPGVASYTYDGNWKAQLENGIDMYHFSSTHASYMELIIHRMKAAGAAIKPVTAMEGEHGTFTFPHGHGVMWTHREGIEEMRTFDRDSNRLESFSERVDPARARWMLYNRNLHIFPNVQIIDIQSHVQTIDVPSLQIRTLRPISADKTEMKSYCLAMKGESRDARRLRLRQYEDFFNPSGLATPDDNVMFERSQMGCNARAGEWTQGYLRGMSGSDALFQRYAKDLRISAEGACGSFSFGDETGFHRIHREWLRLMKAGAKATNRHED